MHALVRLKIEERVEGAIRPRKIWYKAEQGEKDKKKKKRWNGANGRK
jgi:hypothetical protein